MARLSFVVLSLLAWSNPIHAVRNPLKSQCFDCNNACLQCIDKKNVEGGYEVTIDATPCKNSAIGWACCRGSNGNENVCRIVGCDGTEDSTKQKCEYTLVSRYFVPEDATTLSIQTHDRKQTGNTDCDFQYCCGINGSSCETVSSVCTRVIDLSSCSKAF